MANRHSKEVLRGAFWIGLILAFCLIGLLLWGGKASAQKAAGPMRVLVAPLMFNIDSLEVDSRMREAVAEYLRRGAAGFKAPKKTNGRRRFPRV